MAYVALYRAYRPQKFSEVVGQENIIKTLQNAIKLNNCSIIYTKERAVFSFSWGSIVNNILRIITASKSSAQMIEVILKHFNAYFV